MALWAADFETTTRVDDCRVWAWAACEVTNPANVVIDNSIESFMHWCSLLDDGSKVWFHNLKFDGEFVSHYLLTHGWIWEEDVDARHPRTFTTLISDKHQHYSYSLRFTPNKCVEIRDSLKVIPLRIEQIPKAFGLDEAKLSIDYEASREVGHVLTDEERAYVAEDVIIAAKALKILWSSGKTRLTAGSNALHAYKETIGGDRRFRRYFPVLDNDAELRRSYKGGFTWVNPRFQGRMLGEGISFDVNSLYPSRMRFEMLPYGIPREYSGSYERDERYPLHIDEVTFDATLKPDHVPTIQVKESMYADRFRPTDYIEDTGGEIERCMTSVDLELLFESYDVHSITYHRGWKFKASNRLFARFIDEEMELKAKASREGNAGMRQLAKLDMNSSYGKFGTNPRVCLCRPTLREDGSIGYDLLEPEQREPVYIPMASFITAYARAYTIRSVQRVFDRFVYADTDSMYLLGTDVPEGLEVDDVRLGAWKCEHHFDRIKVLRPKTYVIEEGGQLIVHCCGMPDACHDQVTFDNFEICAVYHGKLRPRHTSGGIVLERCDFSIL